MLWCNGRQIEIDINRDRLSDAEAMFILALTLATEQRPVETVLREIRDCARLGIASELDDNLENPSPELTEREIFESTIYEVKHADDWDNQDDILDKLFESPTVRNFVKSFAEYKKHIASFATATDKEAFFRQLSFFEHKLPQLQAAADKALQLGKKRPNKSDSSNNKVHPVNPAEYCVVMAREVTNRQDEAYTRGFRYLPIHTLNGLSPAEKAKLKLVVLP